MCKYCHYCQVCITNGEKRKPYMLTQPQSPSKKKSELGCNHCHAPGAQRGVGGLLCEVHYEMSKDRYPATWGADGIWLEHCTECMPPARVVQQSVKVTAILNEIPQTIHLSRAF